MPDAEPDATLRPLEQFRKLIQEFHSDIARSIEKSSSQPDESRKLTQAFFARLATEIRRPSYGALQRDVIAQLLIRAQEASLYRPEDP